MFHQNGLIMQAPFLIFPDYLQKSTILRVQFWNKVWTYVAKHFWMQRSAAAGISEEAGTGQSQNIFIGGSMIFFRNYHSCCQGILAFTPVCFTCISWTKSSKTFKIKSDTTYSWKQKTSSIVNSKAFVNTKLVFILTHNCHTSSLCMSSLWWRCRPWGILGFECTSSSEIRSSHRSIKTSKTSLKHKPSADFLKI